MEEKLETLIREFAMFQISTLGRLNGIDDAVKDLAKDFHSGDLANLFKRVTTLEEARKRQIEINTQLLEKRTEGKSESKSLWDLFKRK